MLSEGLRPRHVLTVGVATALVSAVVWHLYTRTGSLLQGPAWLTPVVILVIAALVLWFGWQVRAYQQGESHKDLSMLRAARTLQLAQAAALTGGALTGWFIGHLAILLPDRDLTPYARQIVPLLLVVGASVVLAVAGLLAQRWCRLPEDRGDGPQANPA